MNKLEVGNAETTGTEMSETEPNNLDPSNPKLDWRDSLSRHAFEEALARQRALGLINQNDPQVMTALEQVLDFQTAIRAGKYTEAHKALKPGWESLDLRLAHASHALDLVSSGTPDDLERAVELAHPLTLADAHNSLGKLAVNADSVNSVRAEHHFRLALEADPRYHRALTNLGNIELERGEIRQAIERYRQAIKLEPEYATAHNNLAAALRRDGRLSESVAALKRSQRLTVKQDNATARATARAATGVLGGVKSLGQSLGNPYVRLAVLGALAFVIYRFFRA
jgi:tetratricopeptide (TPR) repeat protein